MKRGSLAHIELLTKILRRLLLSPPFRWFVPERHRFMLSLPDLMEQRTNLALKHVKEHLAKLSPEQITALHQEALNAAKEQAQRRPWKH